MKPWQQRHNALLFDPADGDPIIDSVMTAPLRHLRHPADTQDGGATRLPDMAAPT
jgi:hypothetical protein